MKLINVDDLKVLVAVESKGEIRYGKLVTELFDDIPIVEAIPIEWIWNWINTKGVFAQYISDMIAEWEKENEQR